LVSLWHPGTGRVLGNPRLLGYPRPVGGRRLQAWTLPSRTRRP
jgi:hypothetical protein